MNTHPYQLIALDIDGTLLNSRKEITPETERMVRRALQVGKHVVLSTGRSFAELEEILLRFPDLRCGICESGAMVFDRTRSAPISIHPIPLDTARQVEAVARQRDVLIHIFLNGRPVISRRQMSQLDDFQIPYFRPMFERYSFQTEDAFQYCMELETPSIEKINLYHRTVEARDVTRELLSSLPLELVDSEQTSLELSAARVDKGRGLLELCDYLGIPVEATIAVGDSYNDAAVLQTAGLAVGMGNSPDPVRQICDVIVRDCDHDGVAEAIERFLLPSE